MSPVAARSERTLSERLEMLQARHERALESLAALVRRVDRAGGYATDQDQADLRLARAVIAEER